MYSFFPVGMNYWVLALQTVQHKCSQIHCQRKCSHIWTCVLKKCPHCCFQMRFLAIRCAFPHWRPHCTSQFTVPCANPQVSTMVVHSWDGRTKSLCSWSVSPCRGFTVAEQRAGEEWTIWYLKWYCFTSEGFQGFPRFLKVSQSVRNCTGHCNSLFKC